jgi:hypothetical protein
MAVAPVVEDRMFGRWQWWLQRQRYRERLAEAAATLGALRVREARASPRRSGQVGNWGGAARPGRSRHCYNGGSRTGAPSRLIP